MQMKEYRKVSMRLLDYKYRVTVEGQRSVRKMPKEGASFHLFGSLVQRTELNVFVEMKSQIRDSEHGNDNMSPS